MLGKKLGEFVGYKWWLQFIKNNKR
jgi:hypothetical protein